MIGQAPAGLDAEKRSAVGPQCHVWYACKIHRHPPDTRRIDIGEFPPSDINQLEDDRTGQFVLCKRHFATGEFDVARFPRQIISRRKVSTIKPLWHLKMKALKGVRGESGM